VEDGDALGFSYTGGAMVQFDVCSDLSKVMLYTNSFSSTAGSAVSFSEMFSAPCRTYSIYAKIM